MPDGPIEKSFQSDRILIGRSNRCDLCCPHEGLSRNHCLIEVIDDALFITDLGSINGVYIDGNRLSPHNRHPYNLYNSLTISSFECTIEEDASEPTFITRKIDVIQDERTKSQSNKPPPVISYTGIARPKQNYIKALVLFLVVLVPALYFLATDNNDASTPPAKPTISRAVKLKAITPTFKSNNLYSAEEDDKNCHSPLEKYCKKMNLNLNHEGFFLYERDLTIYLKPSLYLTDLRYKGIKTNTDVLELIAMDKILSSPVLDDYFVNSDFQIHLVLKNDSNEIFKVFRFHPEKYSPKTIQRMDALHLLESAIIGTSTSEIFWRHINAYVPVKSNIIE